MPYISAVHMSATIRIINNTVQSESSITVTLQTCGNILKFFRSFGKGIQNVGNNWFTSYADLDTQSMYVLVII